MNLVKVKSYLQEYKTNFNLISQKEIYKWKAINQFQKHWNIDASNFAEMLERSLFLVKNLMDSGQYFPKRMLLNNARKSPEIVRNLFKDLYNEEADLNERIKEFQSNFSKLNKINYGQLKTYQDQRAVLVYLCLRYPDRYYFYKYKMFKDICSKIDYPYNPKTGKFENIGHFQSLCDLLKFEISLDKELLKLHDGRLDSNCFVDEVSNVLTQDFIYAITTHLQKLSSKASELPLHGKVEECNSSNLITTKDSISFKGHKTNYLQAQLENKHLGTLGENWVMLYEANRLSKIQQGRFVSSIKHISVTEGDGTGYDIESVDENGRRIFIEVKTTKGSKSTSFFLTRTEMERSIREGDRYLLYRVYNFDEVNQTADLLIIRGDLSGLCIEPSVYKICNLKPAGNKSIPASRAEVQIFSAFVSKSD